MDSVLWVARRDFYKGISINDNTSTTFMVADDFSRDTKYWVTRTTSGHYSVKRFYKGKLVGTVRMHKHSIEFFLNIRMMVGKEPTKAFLEDARNNTTLG